MSLRLGLLIPCFNEAAVIRRRLLNLRACEWPEGAQHRIVVVDDHSQDDTARIAEDTLLELFGDSSAVRGQVIQSQDANPGKPSALRCGIDALQDDVDLIVMTDADVLFEEPALVHTAESFENSPKLAMATGAQKFVAELSAEGIALANCVGRADLLDRSSSFVRSIEAGFGRTFSVHGPLLAWRSHLGLRPRDGVAADDLDLMLQVRERESVDEGRIVRLSRAVFHERKTPPGPEADRQALRRARAWFQVFRGRRAPRSADDKFRAQYFFYSKGPAWASRLVLLTGIQLLIAGYLQGSWRGVLVTAAILVALMLTPYGRFAWRTLRIIDRARKLEDESPMPARWEPAR